MHVLNLGLIFYKISMNRNPHIIIFTLIALFLGTSAVGEKEDQKGSNPNDRIPKNIDPFQSFIVPPRRRVAVNQPTQINASQTQVNQPVHNSVVNIYNLPNRNNEWQQSEVRPVRVQEQATGNQLNAVSRRQVEIQPDFSKKNVLVPGNAINESSDNQSNKAILGGQKIASNKFEGVNPFESMIIPKKRVVGVVANNNVPSTTRKVMADESVSTSFKGSQPSDSVRINSIPKRQGEGNGAQLPSKDPFATTKFTIKAPPKITSIYELPHSKMNLSTNTFNIQRVQLAFDVILKSIKPMKHISIDLKNNVESLANKMRMFFTTLDNNDTYPSNVDSFLTAFQQFLQSMVITEFTDYVSATSHIVKYELEKFNKVLDLLAALRVETKNRCEQFGNSELKASSCAGVTQALVDLTNDLKNIELQSKSHKSFGSTKPMMSYEIKDSHLDQLRLQHLKKQIQKRLDWTNSDDNNLKTHLKQSKLYEPLKAILSAVEKYSASTNSLPAAELIDSFLDKFDSKIVLFQSFSAKSSTSVSKFLRISDQDKNLFTQFFQKFADDILSLSEKNDSKEAKNIKKNADDIEQVAKSAFKCKSQNYNLELIDGEDVCEKFNNAVKVNQVGTRSTERAAKMVDYITQSINKLESEAATSISPFFNHFVNTLKHAAQVIIVDPEVIEDFSPVTEFIKSGIKFANSLTTHRTSLPDQMVTYNTFELAQAKNFGEILDQLTKRIGELVNSSARLRANLSVPLLVQELNYLNSWFNNLINENGKLYELNDKKKIDFVLPQYSFNDESQKFIKSYPDKNIVYIHNNESTLKALINSLSPKAHEIHVTNFYKVTLPALQVLINFYKNGKYSKDDVKMVEDLITSLHDVINGIKTTQTHYVVGPSTKQVTKTTFNQDKVDDMLTKINGLRNHGKSNWNEKSNLNPVAPHVFDALNEIEQFLNGLEKENSALVEFPNKEDKTFLEEYQRSVLNSSATNSDDLPVRESELKSVERIVSNDIEDFGLEENTAPIISTQPKNDVIQSRAIKRLQKETIVNDINEDEERSLKSSVSKKSEHDPLNNKYNSEPRNKHMLPSEDEEDINRGDDSLQVSLAHNSRLSKPVDNPSHQSQNLSDLFLTTKSLPIKTNRSVVSDPRASQISIVQPNEDELIDNVSEVIKRNSADRSEPQIIENEIGDEDLSIYESQQRLGKSLQAPKFKGPQNKYADNSRAAFIESLEQSFRTDNADSINSQPNLSLPNESNAWMNNNLIPVVQTNEVSVAKDLERKSSKGSIPDRESINIDFDGNSSILSHNQPPSGFIEVNDASIIAKKHDSFSQSFDESLLESIDPLTAFPVTDSNKSPKSIKELVVNNDESLDISNPFEVTSSIKSTDPKKSQQKQSVVIVDDKKNDFDEVEPSPTWSQRMRENELPKVNSLATSQVDVSQGLPDSLEQPNNSMTNSHPEKSEVIPQSDSILFSDYNKKLSQSFNLSNLSDTKRVPRTYTAKPQQWKSLIGNKDDSKLFDLTNSIEAPQEQNYDEEIGSLKNNMGGNEHPKPKSLVESVLDSNEDLSEELEESFNSQEDLSQSISGGNNTNSMEPSMFTVFGRERSRPNLDGSLINILDETIKEKPAVISQPEVLEPERKKKRRRVIVFIEMINCSLCLDDTNLAYFVENVLQIYK